MHVILYTTLALTGDGGDYGNMQTSHGFPPQFPTLKPGMIVSISKLDLIKSSTIPFNHNKVKTKFRDYGAFDVIRVHSIGKPWS